MWPLMKSDQYLAICSAGMGSDMATGTASNPYLTNTSVKPGSEMNTARWPRARQAWAIATEFSAGPKAASGKKTMVLVSLILLHLGL